MSFREEIKSPFNKLMLALAIVGLLTGFYFYYYPRNDKGIAYIAEEPSKIFDSKATTPAIHLVDSSNSPIMSDTYLQTYTVWNTGSLAIEQTDIRRPITFFFPNSERILDVRVVASTDPDICEFKLDNGIEVYNNPGVTEELRLGQPAGGLASPTCPAVSLTWKHFDPKKAIKFLVIFCQQKKPNSLVSADIVGVGKLQAGVKQKDWVKIGMSFFYLGFIIFMVRSVFSALRSKNGMRWGSISFALILIGLVGLLVWALASPTLFSPTPPIM
jgi:hypothetical protein